MHCYRTLLPAKNFPAPTGRMWLEVVRFPYVVTRSPTLVFESRTKEKARRISRSHLESIDTLKLLIKRSALPVKGSVPV